MDPAPPEQHERQMLRVIAQPGEERQRPAHHRGRGDGDAMFGRRRRVDPQFCRDRRHRGLRLVTVQRQGAT
jgi:hypothetical protein